MASGEPGQGGDGDGSGIEVAPRPRRTNRMREGSTLEERRRLRRRDLVDASRVLFGTKGYASTSIEEICRTASVSTRNFYEEFTSREAVLIELVEGLNERTVEAVNEAGARAHREADERRLNQDERARLEGRATLLALVNTVLADPLQARVSLIEARGISVAREGALRDTHLFFARLMNRQLARLGVVLPRSEAGAELFCLAVVAAIDGMLVDHVLRASQTDPEVVDLVAHEAEVESLADLVAHEAEVESLAERIFTVVVFMIWGAGGQTDSCGSYAIVPGGAP